MKLMYFEETCKGNHKNTEIMLDDRRDSSLEHAATNKMISKKNLRPD
jgi:hypothetical protein